MPVTFRSDKRAIAALSQEGGLVFQWVLKLLRASEARAKRYAPVDTGNLRASIRFTVTPGPSGVEGELGSDVIYAGYQHSAPIRDFQPNSVRGRQYITDALQLVNEAGGLGFDLTDFPPVLDGRR